MNTNPNKPKAHPNIKVSSLTVSIKDNIVTELDGKIFVAHSPFEDFIQAEEIRTIANKAVDAGWITPWNQTGTLAAVCLWTLRGFEKLPNKVQFLGNNSRIAVAEAITRYPHVIFPIDVLGGSAKPLIKMHGALRNIHSYAKWSVVRHPHDDNYAVVFCREY